MKHAAHRAVTATDMAVPRTRLGKISEMTTHVTGLATWRSTRLRDNQYQHVDSVTVRPVQGSEQQVD
jgi:hypothetical protein